MLDQEIRKHDLAGEDDHSAAKMEESLAIFKRHGKRRIASEKAVELAFHSGNRGNPEKAGARFLEAFEIARPIRGAEGETAVRRILESLHATALNLARAGKAAQALKCQEPLVRRLEATLDAVWLGQARHNRAWVLAECGKLEESAAEYREVLALRRMLPSVPDLAWTMNNLGYVLVLEGDFREAASMLSEARSRAAAASLADVLAKTAENLELLSRKASEKGMHESAACADLVLLESRDLLPRAHVSRIMRRAGSNLHAASRHGEALEMLDRLASREKAGGNPSGSAAALRLSADPLASLGRKDDAIRALENSLAICREIGDRMGEAETLVAMAGFENSRNAAAMLDAAQAIFIDLDGHRPGLEMVLEKRIGMEKSQGREQAAAMLEKRLSALRAEPPEEDLPAEEFMQGMKERGPKISAMKPSDPVVEISFTGAVWVFRDLPTGKEFKIGRRYKPRKVRFQGAEFRISGQEAGIGDDMFFVASGQTLIRTRDGSLWKRTG